MSENAGVCYVFSGGMGWKELIDRVIVWLKKC